MKDHPRFRTRPLFIGVIGLALLAAAGCDKGSTPGAGGGGLIRTPQSGKELWTIRCTRIQSPDHRQTAQILADLLGKVPGLKARDIRVASDADASTIYYGQYAKVPSSGGDLVFPADYQRDIELIRSLAYRQQTPFFFAAPEPLNPVETSTPSGAEGSIASAKGSYTLQIAAFYNTQTFTERKQAAEQYVRLLREQGYPAYYFHEPLRSFVFVGDFEISDVVRTPQGLQFGPRVRQFIDRNPNEFKYMTENGHLIRHTMPDGRVVTPESLLVPIIGRKPAGQPPTGEGFRPMLPPGVESGLGR